MMWARRLTIASSAISVLAAATCWRSDAREAAGGLHFAECRGKQKAAAAGRDLFPATLPDRGNAINKYILEHLESNEIVSVRRGLVESVHVAQFAANPKLEDTYFVRPKMAADGGLLLGVFDGTARPRAGAFR